MDSRVTSDFVVAAPKLCTQEHSPAVIDMLKSAHQIMPDWSQLPIELLECIARRLNVVVDHLKFSWVCSSWRSTALEFRPYLPPQLPGLMIPNGSDLDSQTRCFSNLSKNKLYKHTLPIPHTEVVVGSAGGSLVTIDQHFNMHIFNPFSNFRVPLPPVSAFPRFPLPPVSFPRRFYNDTMDINEIYVMLAALSSSDPQNIIVMVAAGEYGRLAFARPGDDSWTPIVDGHFPYDDAIFYKGAFYAVSRSGSGTVVCDIEDPHPKTKLIASAPPDAWDVVSKNYLVESAGELLLVHRDLEDETQDGRHLYHYYTVNFDVYKLDMSMHKWNQVKSLDDRALFLGFNTSFSVSSLNYEDCCRDCIYFTDDYQDGYKLGLRGGHDMGIFYLKDRSIKRLNSEDAKLIQPAPIWVTPLPW